MCHIKQVVGIVVDSFYHLQLFHSVSNIPANFGFMMVIEPGSGS